MVDRNFNTTNVVGDWYYPTSETTSVGHSSKLSIRANKTLSLTVSGPFSSETYSGTWRKLEKGQFAFHATQRKKSLVLLNTKQTGEITEEEIDLRFQFRCAVDSNEFLLITEISKRVGENSDLSFEPIYFRLTR